MGTALAFASADEAMDMAHAALSYLATADAAQLAAATQAECLRRLEQADAISTAARASFLAVFTTGKGYSADADYSARAWLMHKTGITRGAAANHTAWAKRAETHPLVVAALAAGKVSESYGRVICRWTDTLPEKYREESDELLIAAALAGLGLADLGALFAEMYERARGDLPDEDPARGFGDRGVRLETTFQGAGCPVRGPDPGVRGGRRAVLEALSAPAGAEDDRTQEQRYHDGLQEAMRRLVAAGPAAGAGRAAGQGLGAHLPGRLAALGWQLGAAGGVDRAGPRALGRAPRPPPPRPAATAGRGWTATPPRRSRATRRWPRSSPATSTAPPWKTWSGCASNWTGSTARRRARMAGRPSPDRRDSAGHRPGLGGPRAGHHRQGRRSAVRPRRPGQLPAPPAARRPPRRPQPAAGHRLLRDHPRRDPQRGHPAGPALPVGRAVRPARRRLPGAPHRTTHATRPTAARPRSRTAFCCAGSITRS